MLCDGIEEKLIIIVVVETGKGLPLSGSICYLGINQFRGGLTTPKLFVRQTLID